MTAFPDAIADTPTFVLIPGIFVQDDQLGFPMICDSLLSAIKSHIAQNAPNCANFFSPADQVHYPPFFPPNESNFAFMGFYLLSIA